MPTEKNKQINWIRIICDVIIYVTAAIGIIISYMGAISPQNTYVRCEDDSINHDVRKDTISILLLLVVCLFVPMGVMTLFEWLSFHQESASSPLREGFQKACSHFLSLLVGGLFAFFVVEILKTAVSEPRPNFMKSCKPNFTKEQCEQPWIHVIAQNCTNPYKLSYYKVIDTMKSFPSGHACLGVLAATFMTMYIQSRVSVSWSRFFKPWFQFIWWVWAMLCCTSRIWDNKHHWWDVAFGAILGLVGGYVTGAYLCNWFEVDSKEQSSNGTDQKSESLPQTQLNIEMNERLAPNDEENGSNHVTDPIKQRLMD